MAAASRQSRRLRKSSKSRRRMVATGLFAAAILVSLVASQCSSSEDSLDDPLSPTTVASTTTSVDAVSTTRVDAPTTAETDSTTTSPPETSPPTTAADDPEDAEQEEQAEETEEQIEEPDSTTSTASTATSTTVAPTTILEEPTSSIAPDRSADSEECSSLIDFLRTEALERVGPTGFVYDDIPDGISRSVFLYFNRSSEFSSISEIDAASIVKSDGRRILALNNQDYMSELRISSIANSAPEFHARIALRGGQYEDFYLSGDRVFAIGRSVSGIQPTEEENYIRYGDSGGVRIPLPYYNSPSVVITEIDISDSTNPKEVRHLRVEGSYIGSAAHDGFARVAIRTSPERSLGFVEPEDSAQASNADVERFNKQIVGESTLEQWLPSFNLHTADGESISAGRLLDCDKLFVPGELNGFDLMSVLSFATDESLEMTDAVSVMADNQYAYVSESSLYLSIVTKDTQEKDITVIHKFSLDPSGITNLKVSGTVVGSPINQDFLHEYEGRLLAITDQSDSDDPENVLTVLEDNGRELIQVAEVGNLGERLNSVSYIADKAFLSTIRQTDPLKVIDISDPYNPVEGGELQLTGSFTYLQPVAENLILVARSEDPTRARGVNIGLFDISDFASPTTLDTFVVDDARLARASESQSLQWLPSRNLALIPLRKSSRSYILGLRVNFETSTLEMVSRVIHDPDFLPEGDPGECEWFAVPSTSLSWSASNHNINTVSTVVVCPLNPNCFICSPENYYSSSGELPKPRELNLVGSPRATIDEIIGEVRLAMAKSNSEELKGLLEALQKPAVMDASQIEITYPGGPYDWDFDYCKEILSSFVVEDDLWTVSGGYIQANDLEFLDRRIWLEIPNPGHCIG